MVQLSYEKVQSWAAGATWTLGQLSPDHPTALSLRELVITFLMLSLSFWECSRLQKLKINLSLAQRGVQPKVVSPSGHTPTENGSRFVAFHNFHKKQLQSFGEFR